jgi:hypothetical protein
MQMLKLELIYLQLIDVIVEQHEQSQQQLMNINGLVRELIDELQ